MAAIYLVRHGQASFGADDYDALSERGLRQSRVLGAALAPTFARRLVVISGAMQRHAQTAQACLEAMERPTQWQADARWNEFDHVALLRAHRPDYADTEKLRAELFATADPQRAFQTLFAAAMARWAAGTHDADYAETWPAFRARCRDALAALVAALPAAHDALVFTSGGPIAALTQELLQIPDEAGLRLNWIHVNCGVTKLVAGRHGITLATFNGHAHFDGAQADLLTYR